MSRMKLKLMSAGVLLGCAFGLMAMRVAWATPGAGGTQTILVDRVEVDEINIKSRSGRERIAIKTKGEWETLVVGNHFIPGGHTGWHSHPGPAFVMITAGTMTLYQADGTSAVYPKGTGFVQEPGDVHLARNEGDTDLEVVTFYLLPAGAAVRTDEDEPQPQRRQRGRGDEGEDDEEDDD